MEPAADSTLTIPQAKALAKALGQSVYSTNSYYMTFTVKEVTNPTYGNMDVVDDDGNEYQIYGLYKDSVTDANRYDKFEYKPVKGDEITVYGAVGSHYSTPQMKNALLDECIAHTHNYVAVVTVPTCTAEGYTTHTCSICGDNYKDTTVAALGHTTENGTCERCEQEVGENAPQTTQAWVLVTDISQLTVGAQVIIAAPEADYAIGDYQKSGNRAGTAITKNGTQATFEDYVEANGYTNNGVEVFTVEAGTKANTFAFKVDTTDTTSNGYIYAASSSSNNLKTSTTKNDNSSWAITIDATTGEASVIAQGSYTRNIMRYNPNNGSPLFACYGNTNTGTGVCFYVLTTITL